MKLIAEIQDAALLMDLIHEQGTCFYRIIPPGVDSIDGAHHVEVVYFSGNRVIHFKGELSKQQFRQLDTWAIFCRKLQYNPDIGRIQVVQGAQTEEQ